MTAPDDPTTGFTDPDSSSIELPHVDSRAVPDGGVASDGAGLHPLTDEVIDEAPSSVSEGSEAPGDSSGAAPGRPSTDVGPAAADVGPAAADVGPASAGVGPSPRAPRARSTPRRPKDPSAPRTTAPRRPARAASATVSDATAEPAPAQSPASGLEAAAAAGEPDPAPAESARPRAPRARQPSARTRTTAEKKTSEPAGDGAAATADVADGALPTTGNAAVEVSRPVRNRRSTTTAEGGAPARPAGPGTRRSTGARATKATASGSSSRPARTSGTGTKSTAPRSRTRAAATAAPPTGTPPAGTPLPVQELHDLDVAAPEAVGLPRVVPRELPELPPAGETPPMVDAVVAAALDELRAAARRPRHATRTLTTAPPEDDQPAADLLPEEPRDFVASAPAKDDDEQAATAAAAFDAETTPAQEPGELPALSAPPATPLSVVPPLAYRPDVEDGPRTLSFPPVPEDVPEERHEPAELHAVPPLVARPDTDAAAVVAGPFVETAPPDPAPEVEDPTSGHSLPDLSDVAATTTVLRPVETEPEPAAIDLTELPESEPEAATPEAVTPEPEPEAVTPEPEPDEAPAGLAEPPSVPDLDAPPLEALPAPAAELPQPEVARPPRPRPQVVRPAATARAPRRARLVVRTVNPWSVFKVAAVVSTILVIIGVIATAILYVTLDSAGVFGSLAKAIDNLNDSGPGTPNPSSRRDFSALIVIGGSTAILLVNAILATVFATIGAFVYNLCASFVGGLELTLTERR